MTDTAAHLVDRVLPEVPVRAALCSRPAETPAEFDFNALKPTIEARVLEMRAAFEGAPDERRAAFRALLGDRKMRLLPDPERQFPVSSL